MFDVAERKRISSTIVYGAAAVLAIGLAIGGFVVAQSATPTF